jgi:hypothetical protein
MGHAGILGGPALRVIGREAYAEISPADESSLQLDHLGDDGLRCPCRRT